MRGHCRKLGLLWHCRHIGSWEPEEFAALPTRATYDPAIHQAYIDEQEKAYVFLFDNVLDEVLGGTPYEGGTRSSPTTVRSGVTRRSRRQYRYSPRSSLHTSRRTRSSPRRRAAQYNSY